MQPKLGVQWNSAASCTSSKAKLPLSFHTLTKPTSLNPTANSSIDGREKSECVTAIENVVPKTTEEFLKTWKKIMNNEKRFEYLLTIR